MIMKAKEIKEGDRFTGAGAYTVTEVLDNGHSGACEVVARVRFDADHGSAVRSWAAEDDVPLVPLMQQDQDQRSLRGRW